MSKTLTSLWDNELEKTLSPEKVLKYRSNLLGSDLKITNYGGGNTSSKIRQVDPLSQEEVTVLWVKGSGGDLGSIDIDGFSTLYLEKLEKLKKLYRGIEHEDEMVKYLPHCTFNLNPRSASIDTPLHAFIPYEEVDHMHPDSIISIACTKNSRVFTEEIFNGELGWLPWQRPGFDLGLKIGKLATEKPNIKGVLLEKHGLFTWGKTSRECYENTLSAIKKADSWLDRNETKIYFGGSRYQEEVKEKTRRKIISILMPHLRGKIQGDKAKVGHFDDSETVLKFVNSNYLSGKSSLGASCPDHFLRTKIYPMIVNFDPSTVDSCEELKKCINQIDAQLKDYQKNYESYYHRCKYKESPPIRDFNPVVYLVPGVGMVTFAKDKTTARIAGEFYINTINIIRGATGVDSYQGLDEQSAFDIEYWSLEEEKLKRMPKPKVLSAKIAFITGGAGAIGYSIAERFLKEDACVILADKDKVSLDLARDKLVKKFNRDNIQTIHCDVTIESQVVNAMEYASKEYGGIDILVCNAGIASSASIEETTLELWNKNMDILSTGYFLTSREGFKILKKQNTGGSIIFIGSKNGLVASPNASAYCTAKASEIQLARSLAVEGANSGIRCNVVNPDAVLRGSKIWGGKWRKERADAYSINNDDLENYYKERSLLKRSVFPEDIAEAVYFWASELSSKSTGNIINVDAGYTPAFTR